MNRTQYAYRCRHCDRRIGGSKTHYVTETGHVLCSRCVFRAESTVPIHAELYPDCPVRWHDLWDHRITNGTRAGVYRALHIEPTEVQK